MIILEFDGQTRVLNAPHGWEQGKIQCGMLPIKDEYMSGVACMSSYWKPDPHELAMLANGAHIKLSVIGTAHPPVAVSVEKCRALIEVNPDTHERS